MTFDYANLFAPLTTQLQSAVSAYWVPIFAVFVGLFALTLGPKLIRKVVGR
jgi:hypothetical protein